MRDFIDTLRPAFLAVVVFTALCGLVYPFAITGAAQAIFPRQAEGSLMTRNGEVVGSSLVGQAFTDPSYFWSRPSALSPPDDATNSTGTNDGPLNPQLHKDVADRVAALRDAARTAGIPDDTTPVPIDLVTSSASGLDPDISPAAAYYQAARVAKVRDVPVAEVRALIDGHVEGRALGLLGDPHVNVLELNLDLDALAAATR
jgi:K+-transporting ATPase ATPase C chain